MELESARARLENARFKSARLENMRAQKFFLEADKARHLQLQLLCPCNKQVGDKTEHQQLHRLWLEDNRFGKCFEKKCIERKRTFY